MYWLMFYFFVLSYFCLHKWLDGLPIKSAGLEDFMPVFLSLFAELRKATLCFVMSICPSGRPPP
jgi:hypothetical protein